MTEDKTRVEINGVQVAASALAAVSSAVLLSTVGVAGTIIGAAIGSVMATVGSAIYSYSIKASRERVAAAQAAAIARMQRARAGMGTRPLDAVGDDEAYDSESAGPSPVDERPPWREALTRLRWKWVASVAAGIFAIALLVIVGFELVSGESVSTLTHGTDGHGHRTSLGFGSRAAAKRTPSPSPSPSPSPTSTSTSSATPSSGSGAATTPSAPPSKSASITPTPTPTPATSSAAPSPSVGQQTGSPTPTASQVP